MADFLLPDVGEGLTEAEIVTWRVAVGDVVEINDVLVDIETAKSIVELPSPYAGEVTALLVAEGDLVPVGEPIISIGAPASAEFEIDLSNPAASGRTEGESLVGRNKVERGPQRRPRKGSASPSTLAGATAQMQVQGAFAPGGAQSQEVVDGDEPAVPASSVAATSSSPVASATGDDDVSRDPDVRPLAKPTVRALARELGVDIASVAPSGERGVVTRDDVLAAAGAPAASYGGSQPTHRPYDAARTAPPPASASYGGSHPTPRPYDARAKAEEAEEAEPPAGTGADPRERREPVKGVRKLMAQAMSDSAFTAPHVTEWVTVDVTRSLRYVDRLRQRPEYAGVKVTALLLLARACMLAMKRTPEINSTFDADAGEPGDAGEVVFKDYVNLGIAAATPRGLVVPNVKDAHTMRMLDLARALGELTATAREGRTQPAEMAGGTFTITNIGVFGIDAGTPIINPGESAILAFGAITKRPWVDEESGEIVARDVATLALSFDHRHVDGAAGSRFLADVASIMRDPANALQF